MKGQVLQIKLDYFKDSGKHYGEGVLELDIEHFFEASAIIRRMQAEKAEFPGLIGTWYGPIVAYHNELPRLFLPGQCENDEIRKAFERKFPGSFEGFPGITKEAFFEVFSKGWKSKPL